jgi:hypothetical protein
VIYKGQPEGTREILVSSYFFFQGLPWVHLRTYLGHGLNVVGSSVSDEFSDSTGVF